MVIALVERKGFRGLVDLRVDLHSRRVGESNEFRADGGIDICVEKDKITRRRGGILGIGAAHRRVTFHA